MSRFKVIVAGSVDGQFKKLFEGVEKFHKKCGPFECLFCVGNFFGSDDSEWKDVVSGKINVPVVTYILGPNSLNHCNYFDKPGELAPNVHYLGKSGVLKCISGLQVAYLSGIDGKANELIHYDEKEVDELIKRVKKEKDLDILLTTKWPKDITKFDKQIAEPEKIISPLISKLAQATKPRYHFSTCPDTFYAPKPYRNDPWTNEEIMHITRFYSLDSVGGKKKWLYAFNITPACQTSSLGAATANEEATKCPYSSNKKNTNPYFSYFGNHDSEEPNPKRSRGTHNFVERKPKEECWFCLANADVNKHLIISIGEYCYLALAKGPLVPDNVLILPIKHTGSSVELPDEVMEEMNKFKNCLINYFDGRNKDVVFYERNYCSRHLQLQVLPIPRSVIDNVKECLLQHALNKHNLTFTELSEFSRLKEIVKKEKYFYVEIVKKKKIEAKLVHIIQSKFPVYFGRDVLASSKILNVPERVDWKQHADDKESEAKMTADFKRNFKLYDFTL